MEANEIISVVETEWITKEGEEHELVSVHQDIEVPKVVYAEIRNKVVSVELEKKVRDYSSSNYVSYEIEYVAKMPCNAEIEPFKKEWAEVEIYGKETSIKEMKYDSDFIVNHVGNCKACQVVMGLSKAKVMNQDQVTSLFEVGKDGYRSHRGNLTSERGVLEHYRTIEAIRLPNGKIVNNTLCWSSGFAHCPHVEFDYELPLSTIERNITSNRDVIVDTLKIVDRKNGYTLFTLNISGELKHFLYGVDENRPFLIQLPEKSRTVDAALLSLEPIEVKEAMRLGLKIERQGDLFFVPLDGLKEVFDIKKAHYVKKFIVTDVNIDGGWYAPTISYDNDSDNYPAIDSYYYSHGYSGQEVVKFDMIHRIDWQQKKLEYYPEQNILETRHIASQVGTISYNTLENYIKINKEEKMQTVVRGQIKHEGRQHSILNLGDTWYAVFKNKALQSWQVQRFGGGGD